MPGGIERFSFGKAAFRERIKYEHARRAAARLRIDVQLRDEMRVESGGAPAGHVQRKTFRALRRQRKFQRAAKGFPVGFARIFPAAKPFQAVGDVADFIAVNFFKQLRRVRVAHGGEAAGEVAREIEVRLLEGQAEAGDVINRVFHRRNAAPEIAAHGQFAEFDAARLHAFEVKPRVFLFVLERLQKSPAKGGGRGGKFQQHERHQFGGEQFVVGKKVEQLAALGFLFEPAQSGKFTFAAGAMRFELQCRRASRRGGRDDGRARTFIGELVRADQLFVQRRREQDAFGKFTEFHSWVSRFRVPVSARARKD